MRLVKKSAGVEGTRTEPSPLRLLSVQEAAYARVSTQTVRRWIKAEEIRTYRAGRQIRIDLSDFTDLLSA